jgi:hypothetical protein
VWTGGEENSRVRVTHYIGTNSALIVGTPSGNIEEP